MLEVTADQLPSPLTGPAAANLNLLVGPVQNLVNGYNIAEQTCFHKKTVSNLINSLEDLSKYLTALVGLASNSATALTTSTTLVEKSATLAEHSVTLMTTLVSLVTGLTGQLSNIIGNIIRIRNWLASSAVLALAAGVSFALGIAWGQVPLGIGGVAIGALLFALFVATVSQLNGVLPNLGAIRTTVDTLAGPLDALAGVSGSLPPVLNTLNAVKPLLPPVQSSLNLLAQLGSTTGYLLRSIASLREFLPASPTPPGPPRLHLEDTYLQARSIYLAAADALKLDPQASETVTAVGDRMLMNAENGKQLKPGTPAKFDKTLACVAIPTVSPED